MADLRVAHVGRGVQAVGVGVTQFICFGCGATLTDEERHYYGGTCEECERDSLERIEAWRKGGEDAELDEVFSTPKAIAH